MSPLALAQQNDVHISKVYKILQKPTLDRELTTSSEDSTETKKLLKMIEHLHLQDDGVLKAVIPLNNRRRAVVICPGKQRREVIAEKHESAHLGIGKTAARIRLEWYWPGMFADVRRYVSACANCQQSKVVKSKLNEGQYHLYAGRPWQTLAVDLRGPFPKTERGNTQILVMTDHFTRWCDAIPIPDGKTDTVEKTLEERVIAYFGNPEKIHTDQGRQFESQLFKELCSLWGTKKTRSSPYHPQGNSVVERLNRTLGASLRALLIGRSQGDWDLLPPSIMRGIRATPHSITSETPNGMMFRQEL